MTTPKPECQSAQGFLSPLLARWRVAKAKPYVRGRRTLDYGCGDGNLARFCTPDKYFGVDISPTAVATARALHPGYRFDTAPPQDETYDVVVLLAVLEHIPDPVVLLKDVLRRLNPGGIIVATTPSPSAHCIHQLGARLGLFSREAAEEHEQLLSRKAVSLCVAESGGRLAEFTRFMGPLNQFFVIERNG